MDRCLENLTLKVGNRVQTHVSSIRLMVRNQQRWPLCDLTTLYLYSFKLTWHEGIIVITLLSLSSVNITFQSSSPKPLGTLEPSLASMFTIQSLSVWFWSEIQHGCWPNNVFWFVDILKISSETTLQIWWWYCRNVH